MKKLLFAAALALCSFAAFAQATPTVYSMNTHAVGDTAKGATTLKQSKKVASKCAITIQADATRLTDTVTVTLSVWGSTDGVTYAPWPGADSITATLSATNTILPKMWFLSTPAATSQVYYYEVHARCASNTTNAASKTIVKSRLFTYY